MTPSLPANSIQAVGIPGMPQTAMIPASGPSTGFIMQHNFPVNVQPNQVFSLMLLLFWECPCSHYKHIVTVLFLQNNMWPLNQQQTFKPQDTQNQQQSQNHTDLKHRDYLKQQQRLKAMPLSSSKVFHLLSSRGILLSVSFLRSCY